MRHRLGISLGIFLVACSPGEAPPGAEAPTADPSSVAAEAPPVRDGAERASPEPEAAPRGPRVVFLGTSLTAGLGLLRPEDTYVARVAVLADSAGIPMVGVNAGVSGETSAGGLRRVDWVLRDGADILVVELGANDGLRGHDPDATAANLRAIVRGARERLPDVEVLISAMEAPPNLGESYTERFRAIFPTVAQETGARLVPFLLDGVAGVPELNQADGIHPTPEGHRRMAHNLWPSLEPVLRDWWARHPRPGAGAP